MNAGIAYPMAHLGIIGTGLLAIPVLAGSTAYAIGEGRKCFTAFRAMVPQGPLPKSRRRERSSSARSHLAMTSVATPLPIRFVGVSACDITVDSEEDERDALDRDRSDGGKRRGEHDKGGAGDAGRSFCCEQQHRQQPERPGRHPAGITAGIGSVSWNGSEGPKGGPLWRRRLSE